MPESLDTFKVGQATLLCGYNKLALSDDTVSVEIDGFHDLLQDVFRGFGILSSFGLVLVGLVVEAVDGG